MSTATPWTVLPFSTFDAFLDRQYADFVLRSPTASERSGWAGAMIKVPTDGDDDVVTSPTDLIVWLSSQDAWAGVLGRVTRLYQAVFLRLPDYGGLTYWSNRQRGGTSLASIAGSFVGSSEFVNRYGALTNRDFVELVYHNVLGRAGDPSGINYWTSQLNSGVRTRGDVMVGFSESSEFIIDMSLTVRVLTPYVGMRHGIPSQSYIASSSSLSPSELAESIYASDPYANPLELSAPSEDVRSYDDLFTRFEDGPGWIQGDGGGSVSLGDGRELWLFGDSNLGSIAPDELEANKKVSPSSPLVRHRRTGSIGDVPVANSMVVTQPGTNRFDTVATGTASSGNDLPVIEASDLPAGAKYYPGAAVLDKDWNGDPAIMAFASVSPGTSDSPDQRGNVRLISIDPTTLAIRQRGEWLLAPTRPCGSDSRPADWGKAVLSEGPYIYVYGVSTCGFDKKTYVARVDAGSIADQPGHWWYRTATGWSQLVSDAVPVFDLATDSIVRTQNGYVALVARWWVADPVQQRTIEAYFSTSPYGPWRSRVHPTNPTLPVWSYVMPDDQAIGLADSPYPQSLLDRCSTGTDPTAVGRKYYLPIAHPGISRTGPSGHVEVLVSYSSMHTGLPMTCWKVDVGYRIRFTWLDISML